MNSRDDEEIEEPFDDVYDLYKCKTCGRRAYAKNHELPEDDRSYGIVSWRTIRVRVKSGSIEDHTLCGTCKPWDEERAERPGDLPNPCSECCSVPCVCDELAILEAIGDE